MRTRIAAIPFLLCAAFVGCSDDDDDAPKPEPTVDAGKQAPLPEPKDSGLDGHVNVDASHVEDAGLDAQVKLDATADADADADAGVTPALGIEDVDFSDVPTGFGARHVVTVTSLGDVPLILGTIAGLSTPFSVIDACSGKTLAPGATCTITLGYQPSSVGPASTTFDVPSNVAGAARVVHIVGAGIAQPPAVAARVARTGQVTCYDKDGKSVTCAGTRHDGDLQTGVVWPAPRFHAGSGGESDCLIDDLTGLMWPKSGDLAGFKTWAAGLTWVAQLNGGSGLCGHTDWRLPSKNELRTLVNFGVLGGSTWLNGQGFSMIMNAPYWSSTTCASPGHLDDAWSLNMNGSYVFISEKSSAGDHHVLPVRTATTTAPAPPIATRQTECFNEVGAAIACAGTGQDGELRRGVAWPVSRFLNAPDGTILDSLTGLSWAPRPDTPTLSGCVGGAGHWNEMLDYVACLNTKVYLGHADWRVPNANEMLSVAKADDRVGQAIPFTSGQLAGNFWTSDTNQAFHDVAYVFGEIGVPSIQKSFDYPVWPVR